MGLTRDGILHVAREAVGKRTRFTFASISSFRVALVLRFQS